MELILECISKGFECGKDWLVKDNECQYVDFCKDKVEIKKENNKGWTPMTHYKLKPNPLRSWLDG